MTTQSARERDLIHVAIVGLLAWTVPGGGYWALGDRRRALVVGLTITVTFLMGLYIGSLGVVDQVGAKYWYAAQVMTSPAVFLLGRYGASGVYAVYGRPYEIGQIYTSIAGLLNLLCIINALYIAHIRQPHALESTT